MADQNNNQSGNNSQTDAKSNQSMGQNERKPEQAGTDQERKDKSAIGGGNTESSNTSGQFSDKSKTDEKSSTEPAGQGR